jgi:perosamine synthetase
MESGKNLIPYSTQTIDAADFLEIARVLGSSHLTQGKFVERFEEIASQYFCVENAVACSSGTAALHLLLLGLSLPKDSWAWIPANTFVATANMAVACGLQVRFIDIDESTLNIDITEVERLILEVPKSELPSVIIAVHFGGNPADLDRLSEICDSHDIILIEDAAHASSSVYQGQKVGNHSFSKGASFSFHPVKPITTGEGGIVTTSDKDLARKMSNLRSHGLEYGKCSGNENETKITYDQSYVGFNYRLAEMPAALGCAQFAKLDTLHSDRKKLAERYNRAFQGNDQIRTQLVEPTNESSYHLYPIILPSELVKLRVVNALRKEDIIAGNHYMPVFFHSYYRKFAGSLECKRSIDYFKCGCTIPLYPKMNLEDQEKIIEIILLNSQI